MEGINGSLEQSPRSRQFPGRRRRAAHRAKWRHFRRYNGGHGEEAGFSATSCRMLERDSGLGMRTQKASRSHSGTTQEDS